MEGELLSITTAVVALLTLGVIVWQAGSAKTEARNARTPAYLARYLDALSQLRGTRNVSESSKFGTQDSVTYQRVTELLGVAEELAGLYRKNIVDRATVRESLRPSIGWLENAYNEVVIGGGRDPDTYPGAQYLVREISAKGE